MNFSLLALDDTQKPMMHSIRSAVLRGLESTRHLMIQTHLVSLFILLYLIVSVYSENKLIKKKLKSNACDEIVRSPLFGYEMGFRDDFSERSSF